MYKRWRVYSTFLTAFLIGLAYALLLSNPLSLEVANPLNGANQFGLEEWQTLVLTFSGILGGVIYTIVINGKVEMPCYVANQGALFSAGLFGDILLGIAGAFVLELLLPAELSGFVASEGLSPATFNGTAIAATGILGGYGGRAVLKFSLERFFQYAGVLDETRAEARIEKNRVSEGGSFESSGKFSEVAVEDTSAGSSDQALSLIEQIDYYIQDGLGEREWAILTQQLQAASAAVRQEVFTALVDLRQIVAKEKLTSAQLQRMIPLWEKLTALEPNSHRYYFQIASIQADLEPPNYAEALGALDRAIIHRGSLTIGLPWQYELQRAAVNIQQAQAQSTHFDLNFDLATPQQEAILADLLAIAKVYNLDSILRVANAQQIPGPVLNWLRHNQALLAKQAETRSLITSLRPILQGSPLRPAGTSSAPVVQTPTADPEEKLKEKSEANLEPSMPNAEKVPAPLASSSVVPDNPRGILFPQIYSALGRCYDILQLDPFNISGSAKTTGVFNFYPGEAFPAMDEGETIWIPRGTRYIPGSRGSLQASTQTSILYTERDVQKLFASTLGGVAMQLLGAVLPFSLSASYRTFRQERKTEKSIYAFTKAEYVHYALKIPWESAPGLHLNEMFRDAVAQLPLTATDDYFNLIENFGTHVSTQVEFGGLVHHRFRLSQSVYAAATERGANVAIEAQKIFQAKYANEQKSSTFQEIADSSDALDFCGGIAKANIHDWFDTIKGDPAPIHLALMPLHELLDKIFFSQDAQILTKRSLLAEATQRYLGQNSQTIAWELWPSVAVGGNGGEEFCDIDLTPNLIEANQARLETAQITEVRVWIKNWIERVQTVLEGDVAPLPGHGSEEGDLKILRLDPGDYITAAYVMPGSPQKIVVDRGTYVGSLKLHTHQGKVWTVGIPDSRAISLDIPEGYQVIGFHGRCGKYIDKLGVISMPVPAQVEN
jgi:hypothetical protein